MGRWLILDFWGDAFRKSGPKVIVLEALLLPFYQTESDLPVKSCLPRPWLRSWFFGLRSFVTLLIFRLFLSYRSGRFLVVSVLFSKLPVFCGKNTWIFYIIFLLFRIVRVYARIRRPTVTWYWNAVLKDSVSALWEDTEALTVIPIYIKTVFEDSCKNVLREGDRIVAVDGIRLTGRPHPPRSFSDIEKRRWHRDPDNFISPS